MINYSKKLLTMSAVAVTLGLGSNVYAYTTKIGDAEVVSCSSIGYNGDPNATCFVYDKDKTDELRDLIDQRKLEGLNPDIIVAHGFHGE